MGMTMVIIGRQAATSKLSTEAYRVKRNFSFACRAKKNGRDSAPVFVSRYSCPSRRLGGSIIVLFYRRVSASDPHPRPSPERRGEARACPSPWGEGEGMRDGRLISVLVFLRVLCVLCGSALFLSPFIGGSNIILTLFAAILTPDPSPPVERGGSSLPFSTREKGKG